MLLVNRMCTIEFNRMCTIEFNRMCTIELSLVELSDCEQHSVIRFLTAKKTSHVGPLKPGSVNCEVPSTMNKTWTPADVFITRKINITFYMDSTDLTAKITKSDPARTTAGSVMGRSLLCVGTKTEAKPI